MIRDQMEKIDTIHSVLSSAPLTITLTGYQEKKKNVIDWYSPPYYTHLLGYKMCVNVDVRPTDKLLDVFSYLLPGEYDDGLKWPFRGTVVVRLLNQLSDDNHYDYVFDYSRARDNQSRRVRIGKRSEEMDPTTPRLPLTALGYNASKKCQYLKNDCLKFKVFVKMCNY